MKKLLVPLLSFLLFMACEKELVSDKDQNKFASGRGSRTSPKINIWHYDASSGKWKQITINETGWPEHQAHGDIRQIGDDYQGGKIAYILQSGDPGYDANIPHGLIAAPSDQSTGIQWWNGTFIITGATGTALGTGLSNTNLIVAAQGAGSYAAKLCYDLVLNTFSDWYLPSKDELNKLYDNRGVVGFAIDRYWSSTDHPAISPAGYAYFLHFNYIGALGFVQKDNTFRVRAVRAF